MILELLVMNELASVHVPNGHSETSSDAGVHDKECQPKIGMTQDEFNQMIADEIKEIADK